LEKSFSVDSKLVESLPIEKPRRKSFDRASVAKENENTEVFGTTGASPSNQFKEPKEESLEMALKNDSGKKLLRTIKSTKDQR